MTVRSPQELGKGGLGVRFINALPQYWQTTRSFQCFGNPKKQHLLLYLDGCRITYTDKEGCTVTAGHGDVVYTPLGSEYRAVLSDFRNEDAHTVGINFTLWDERGEPLALSDGITVFKGAHVPTAPLLFSRALSVGVHSPLGAQILMLELLDALCRPARADVPDVLKPALQLLAEECGSGATVGDMARACHISEPYLRRLFKASTGLSPADYRKRLRLSRACDYLTYGDVAIGESAELLGYTSVSHFIKEFGRAYGTSPLRYRRASNERG
jgi:AraC-like DNA-binding protein